MEETQSQPEVNVQPGPVAGAQPQSGYGAQPQSTGYRVWVDAQEPICAGLIAGAALWHGLPADARAVIGIASSRVLAKRLAPTVARLPEAVGALDLVRSLVGIDLRDPDGCRQEGLDPDRGLDPEPEAGDLPARAAMDDVMSRTKASRTGGATRSRDRYGLRSSSSTRRRPPSRVRQASTR